MQRSASVERLAASADPVPNVPAIATIRAQAAARNVSRFAAVMARSASGPAARDRARPRGPLHNEEAGRYGTPRLITQAVMNDRDPGEVGQAERTVILFLKNPFWSGFKTKATAIISMPCLGPCYDLQSSKWGLRRLWPVGSAGPPAVTMGRQARHSRASASWRACCE
jgi:hypothetical protein